MSKTITFNGVDFPVSYCGLCKREVVSCSRCGNNTCNGGYGEVDGVQCTLCPAAYEADKTLP